MKLSQEAMEEIAGKLKEFSKIGGPAERVLSDPERIMLAAGIPVDIRVHSEQRRGQGQDLVLV